MFIELHDHPSKEAFLIAKDLIKMVLSSDGHAIIIAGTNLDVSESYEQVKSLLAVSSIG